MDDTPIYCARSGASRVARKRHTISAGTVHSSFPNGDNNPGWSKRPDGSPSELDGKGLESGHSDGRRPEARPAEARDEPHQKSLRPETGPITEEDFVNDVRSIYANLVMVEKICIDIDKQQLESPNTPPQIVWQTLISLHRTLLHEHHHFFIASQHPSASPVLKNLCEKYVMPARMWRYGIHSFLELLRYRLPDSWEHTLTFINLAYSMLTLLLKSVPAFEDIWIECLGDLARYRMAVEDSDLEVRKRWTDVARNWYHQASEKNPNVGRIQHHLAVLARPDMVQQLFHYTKSLVSVRPFPSAGESILFLFDPLLNGPGLYVQPVAASAFVAAHGCLFTQRPISDLKAPVQEYLSRLEEYINQFGAAFKIYGAYMALCNFAAIFQYGSMDAMLPPKFEEDFPQRQQQGEREREGQPPKLIYYGSRLAFETFSVILDQIGNEHVYPAVHVYLAFIWCMALNDSMGHIDLVVPWSKFATFLNRMIRSDTDFNVIECDEFPVAEDRKNMPEDFLIRGQVWSQRYFPVDYFKDAMTDDDGRSIEVPSLRASRTNRCLWLGRKLAKYFIYDLGSFSVTPFARELEKAPLSPFADEDTSSNEELQDS